jgi:hypothetical protein
MVDDAKGRGKVTDEKETLNNEPNGVKPIESGSRKKKDEKNKKHIKKIVYYDSNASSSSPKDDDDSSSSKKKTVKRNYSKTSLIIRVFLTMPTIVYCLFLLASLLTLM